MYASHDSILCHLPVDNLLQEFLRSRGLVMPDDFEWVDTYDGSLRLLEAIYDHPDAAVRERIVADLQASAALAHERGQLAIHRLLRDAMPMKACLDMCASDLHRSFWLFTDHRDVFDLALGIAGGDPGVELAQHHDLGGHEPVQRDRDALDRLCESVLSFFCDELGGRGICTVLMLERPQATLLSMYVQRRATLDIDVVQGRVVRTARTPSTQLLLEYSARTGTARTLVPGGARCHQMLVALFSKHMLGREVDPRSLRTQPFDLHRLMGDLPLAVGEDGVAGVALESVTFQSPSGARFDIAIPPEPKSVTALLQQDQPHENPLAQGWPVVACTLVFRHAPAPAGSSRRPDRELQTFTVHLNRAGRSDLLRLSDALRAKAEAHLVAWGVMQPNQSLWARDADHADARDVGLAGRGRWTAATAGSARSAPSGRKP